VSGWAIVGSSTRQVVPPSTTLSTSIHPPWLRTIPSTAASPRPRPVNFVV
jgi:hypothetical protein